MFRSLHAQAPARVYRVAFLTVGTTNSPQFAALRRRFNDLGYVEGKNFLFESRALGGQWEKLPEAAAELARARPDVVIAPGSEFLLKAVRQVVGATPIVMIAIDFDPVEKNYIANLARPGGNITGLFFRQVETAAKRLQLLKEALPSVKRVAALIDQSTRDQLRAAEEAAVPLGIALLPQQLRGSPYDFEVALAASASARAQAVLALSSAAFFIMRDKLIAAAHGHRLPVIANPNYAEAGALVASARAIRTCTPAPPNLQTESSRERYPRKCRWSSRRNTSSSST